MWGKICVWCDNATCYKICATHNLWFVKHLICVKCDIKSVFGATHYLWFLRHLICVWCDTKQANCRFMLCYRAQVSPSSHRCHHMYHQLFIKAELMNLTHCQIIPLFRQEKEGRYPLPNSYIEHLACFSMQVHVCVRMILQLMLRLPERVVQPICQPWLPTQPNFDLAQQLFSVFDALQCTDHNFECDSPWP